ncbi:glycosyltransferase family 4 protein [Echinicola vietnamensis]|uniref:Glycosyltransferase n=1 Tax=Echinicola vietnamensis (strain DSM 17526 / LMG 23754 / KMM 6221) TaxID=926556 RepID=L0G2H3_ECHVK|nr:glycosyltransferase family 4 protein [Echinicola vietnamensis]AGA80429.1 glycosyltransferase [Echinicola vietnamensis DSM 17526]
MKILYINSLYAPDIRGGAELSLKLMVEGMQSRGFDVAVLALMPEGELHSSTVDGVKVYRAGLKNRYWPYDTGQPPAYQRLLWHVKDRENRDMMPYLREVVARERPDVVSCHNLAGWSVAVWDELRTLGIPMVQVLHDLYLLCPNSNMYKNDTACKGICMECKLLRLHHQGKSAQVNAVVGISQSILQRFEAEGYFPHAHKQVIHNTRQIPDPGPPRTRTAQAPLRVGYLGTLSRIKGIEWLIETVKQVDFPIHLHIAGKGKESYETHLRSISEEHANIEFMGYAQPAELFSNIDVLAVPSLWEEPLGMVAIEALAHHIPVVANAAGGLKETVQEGINGFFCHGDEPASLAAALKTLYENPEDYQRLSAQARGSVAAILDRDRMLDAYQDILETTLNDLTTNPI